MNKPELNRLAEGSYIAFPYNFYNRSHEEEIQVARITSIHIDSITKEKSFLCHFLYGLKSVGEYIKESKVIAIGDNVNGTEKISGWSGKFIIIQPEHKLLKSNALTNN